MFSDGALVKYFIIPLVTLVLALLLKFLSRNRVQYKTEDLLVGFDLIMGSMFILIGEILNVISKSVSEKKSIIEIAPKFEQMIWFFILYLVVSLILALFIRTYGWDSKEELKRNIALTVNLIGAAIQASLLYLFSK
jgi:hypothetical protein